MDFVDAYSEDKKVSREHFKQSLEKHGDSIKAVNWGSEESQEARFNALIYGGNENCHLINLNILDVGCGRGDLYGWLTDSQQLNVDYLGVDICPEMIELAKQRYPRAPFAVMDIMKSNMGNYDIVVACGIFSLKTPNWAAFVKTMMKRMFEICTVFCAATFLSDFTPFEKHANSYHADPGWLFDTMGSCVSRNMVLLHNYKQNDFTIKIFK